ncbi:ABC transporter permease, partial [Rhodococcus sp. (in: high G+C Gram-positive bacteria)]|uniref:ABC transporter permease n=1 Tax=Rhodococcus sp. TaxID=1831 RepID=UPI003BAF1F73
MFVASRDLRAARGRFALISVVVLLVALLVTFLSGLTSGLRHQNVSAVEGIDADAIVFAETGSEASFDESALTEEQVALWRRDAVSVVPIGLGRGTAGRGDGAHSSVAVIGADSGFGDRTPREPGTIVLSQGAARSLDAAVGDSVSVGAGPFTVASIIGDDWYSHTPV